MHPSRARHTRFIAIAATLWLGGCAGWRPATVPIPTIRIPSTCATRPDTLVVMLPGAASRPEEFETEGMVGALHARGIAADVLLVDAHLGYYRDRSVIERLSADVIAPAQAQGYRHVWLVGISLGGFGAMIYTAERPQGIDGIIAIAPYLGERATLDAVRAQGGLKSWRAPHDGPLDADDIGTPLWRWLQPYAFAQENAPAILPAISPTPAPAARPPLYLGYGLDDRLRPGHDLLAAALPSGHVFTAPGGHDYPAWRAVWLQALDAAPLPRDPGCRPRN